MEEIQHAKANDSMPHSSQILSELPLFLPVLALQCQSVTNSPRSAENYCRNRRGDLISSGSYINYINSLTGQLLILFPGIIICIQLNLHKTTIVCFYLVPTFKVHKSFQTFYFISHFYCCIYNVLIQKCKVKGKLLLPCRLMSSKQAEISKDLF